MDGQTDRQKRQSNNLVGYTPRINPWYKFGPNAINICVELSSGFKVEIANFHVEIDPHNLEK